MCDKPENKATNQITERKPITNAQYLLSLWYYQHGDIGAALEINPGGLGGDLEAEEYPDAD